MAKAKTIIIGRLQRGEGESCSTCGCSTCAETLDHDFIWSCQFNPVPLVVREDHWCAQYRDEEDA